MLGRPLPFLHISNQHKSRWPHVTNSNGLQYHSDQLHQRLLRTADASQIGLRRAASQLIKELIILQSFLGKIFELLLFFLVSLEGNVTFLQLRQLCIEFLDRLLSFSETLHKRNAPSVQVAATSSLTHRFGCSWFHLTALRAPLETNQCLHYRLVSD